MIAVTISMLLLSSTSYSDVLGEWKRFKDRGYKPSTGWNGAANDVANNTDDRIKNEYRRFENRNYQPSQGWGRAGRDVYRNYQQFQGITNPTFAPSSRFVPGIYQPAPYSGYPVHYGNPIQPFPRW